MFFIQRQVPDDPASLAYFFGCGGKGHAIAVDVHASDVDWFLAQARQKAVKIDYVIDTHIHADHVSGARLLADKSGAQYALHHSAQAQFQFLPLDDQQTLKIGNVSVRILHTPGHTHDSICLLVTDHRRTDEPWFLLTGHTFFVGSVGRPDLRGQAASMAEQLYASLQQKVLTLPEHIELYPGAQAGSVCGAGLSGKPVSTLAFEKRFNPLLTTDQNSFVTAVLENLPPEPERMQAIITANRLWSPNFLSKQAASENAL
ncbi:MAG: MBL fold metallo-hydrolase [Thiotrichales bacterium]